MNATAVRRVSAFRALEHPFQSMPELEPASEGVLHAVCSTTLHTRVMSHKRCPPAAHTSSIQTLRSCLLFRARLTG